MVTEPVVSPVGVPLESSSVGRGVLVGSVGVSLASVGSVMGVFTVGVFVGGVFMVDVPAVGVPVVGVFVTVPKVWTVKRKKNNIVHVLESVGTLYTE